jgi:hypothetical protein
LAAAGNLRAWTTAVRTTVEVNGPPSTPATGLYASSKTTAGVVIGGATHFVTYAHRESAMQQIDSISTYLRHFAHQLEDRILKQFPPLHQPEDPLPPELRRLQSSPLRSPGISDRRAGQAPRNGKVFGCYCRVWDRKDIDIVGRDSRSREGKTVHGAGDGPSSTGDKDGQRMLPDAATSPCVPDRWRAKWRWLKRLRRRERGSAPQWPGRQGGFADELE